MKAESEVKRGGGFGIRGGSGVEERFVVSGRVCGLRRKSGV